MNEDALILMIVFSLLATGYAMITDIKERKIKNNITFPMFFAGFAFNGLFGGLPGLQDAALGFLILFGIFYILYMTGGMGAGDVKLMGALGAWWGMWLGMGLMSFVGVWGLIIALIYIIKTKQVKAAKSYVQLGGKVKMDLIDKEKIYIPYGVPIFLGTLSYSIYSLYMYFN